MTTHNLSVSVEAGTIHLVGQLDRFTVTKLDKDIHLKRFSDEKVMVNLTDVSKVDTAGLAWILKVKATADQAGQHFGLIQAPSELMVLARLSGVESLLATD